MRDAIRLALPTIILLASIAIWGHAQQPSEDPPTRVNRFTISDQLVLPSQTSVILKTDADGVVGGAAAGTDYLAPAGNGSQLTALNASALASGTIPDARFPATLPAASGANLTALNASNLASGTVPDARFPATLPALSGANLTGLNAGALASGTIPDGRFPATLPAASGANLTNLNASSLANGTVSNTLLDSDLQIYAGITPSANVQTLLGAANYSAFRSSLGVAIGSDVQAYSANLTTYAGIAPSANVQSLLGAANYAAIRGLLDLEVGADVQAFDADLSSWSAVVRASGFDTFAATPSSANLAALVSNETGSGALVFGTGPTLTNPILTGTTTSSAGQTGFNPAAWDTARGAVQVYDGTANTYLIGVLASDTPAAGEVPKFNANGTITWEADTSGAGGVADGDKGDITVAGDGATWTIDTNVVDLANLQQVNTGTLLGRFSASTGNVESLSISANVQSLLGAADYAAMKGLLDLEIGTDVQAFDDDLSALAGLSSTGLAVRTASNTWAQRTVTGTTNQVTVTNGDGVSGNPTISLPSTVAITTLQLNNATLAAADATAYNVTLPAASGSLITAGQVASGYQPLDADLTTYAGIPPSANVQSLLGAADYAAMRSQLGLVIGTNVQAYDADLTTWAGIAPSANIQTFLGSADYSAARTNLGVAIGSNVQAWDADLDTYAGITPSANVQSFLGASNYAGMRSQLDLEVGTDVQAYDADLAALAGVTSAADKVPYFTGSGTATVTDLTSFARTLLDDSSAATARATLEAAPAGTAVLITDTATQTRYQAASDSDAARGTALVNAQTAAASGDTIIVGPGNYTISTALGKDGVNWHLMPGVVITTSSGISIFTDGGSAMTFTISGGGVIRGNAEYGVYTGHADSNIAIQCRSIESTNNAAVRANAGKISIVATERIYSGVYDGLWASGGTIYCYVPTIAAANNAIEVTQAGSVYVRAETIGYGDEPIYFDGNGSGVGFVSCQRIVLQNLAIAIHSDGMSNSVVVCPHIQGQVNHLGGVLRVVGGKLGMIGGTAATVRVVDNGLTLENCQIDSPSGASESIDADSTTPTVTIIGSLTHNKAIDAGVTLTYSTASNYLAQIKTVDGNGSGLDADLVRGTTPSTAGLDILDIANGSNGQFLKSNGDGTVSWDSPSGSGDVTAASSFGTDNRLIRSDGTGKGVQASGITLDDSNNLTGIGDVTADGLTLNDLTASRIVVTDGSKVLTSGAAAPSGAFVGTTDTQTLTSKTIDSADNTVILANAMLPAVQPGTAVETGDGALYFAVPASWNGRDITSVRAFVTTAGTTGTTDIQIARIRSGTPADVLSTKLTIDSGETTSDTADAAAVINTSNDDLATDDILRVDVDAVSGTAPEGLFIQIGTGT